MASSDLVDLESSTDCAEATVARVQEPSRAPPPAGGLSQPQPAPELAVEESKSVAAPSGEGLPETTLETAPVEVAGASSYAFEFQQDSAEPLVPATAAVAPTAAVGAGNTSEAPLSGKPPAEAAMPATAAVAPTAAVGAGNTSEAPLSSKLFDTTDPVQETQANALQDTRSTLGSKVSEKSGLHEDLMNSIEMVANEAAKSKDQRVNLSRKCSELQTMLSYINASNANHADSGLDSAATVSEATRLEAREVQENSQVLILQHELAEETAAATAESARNTLLRIATEAQLREVNEVVSRLENEVKSLKTELENQTTENALHLDAREQEMKAFLEEARAQKRALKETLAEIKSQNERAKETAKSKSLEAAAESEEQLRNLSKLCAKLQAEVESLTATNANATKAREWAERNLTTAQAETKAALDQASNASAQITQLQREKVEVEAESNKTKVLLENVTAKSATEVAEAYSLAEQLRNETRLADVARAASAAKAAKVEATAAIAAAEAATLHARKEQEASLAAEAAAEKAGNRSLKATAHVGKLRQALDSAYLQSRRVLKAQAAAGQDGMFKLEQELSSLRSELATSALAAVATKRTADKVGIALKEAISAKNSTEAALRELRVNYEEGQEQKKVLKDLLAAANNQSAMVNARIVALDDDIDAITAQAAKAATRSEEAREKLVKTILSLQADKSGLKQELASSAAARTLAEISAANLTASAAQARLKADEKLAAAEAQTIAARRQAAEASSQVSQLQRALNAALTAATQAASAANQTRLELEAQVAAESDKVLKLEREVADFTTSLSAQIQKLNATLLGAQRREKELRESLADMSSDRAAATSRVNLLEERLGEAQASTVAALTQSDTLRTQFKEDCSKLEAIIKGLKVDVATNADRRVRAEGDAAAMAKAADESAKARERAEKLVAIAEANSEAAGTRAAKALSQVSEMQREVAFAEGAAAQAISIANTTQTALEAQISVGQAKEKELQAAIEGLKSELVQETLAASSAKSESEKAVSTLKAKLADQAALRKVEVDAHAKATEKLSSQIQTLELSLAQAQEREKRMQESMAALSGGKGEVKAQMLTLQKELEEAQASAATATAKAKEVQGKYARDRLQLEAEVEGLKADVADYAVGKAEAETAAAKASAETSALRASSRSQRLSLVAKETELKEQLEQARLEGAHVRAELIARQREASEALRKRNWLLGGLFQSQKKKKKNPQQSALTARNSRHKPRREHRALTKPRRASSSLTWRLPRVLRLSFLFILATAATHFAMGLAFLF